MRRSRGRALNGSYAELLDHYELESTRINSGESHENGVAEQAHYRLKDAIDQALMLQGSRDFSSVDQYTCFVRRVVEPAQPHGALRNTISAWPSVCEDVGGMETGCRMRTIPPSRYRLSVLASSLVRAG